MIPGTTRIDGAGCDDCTTAVTIPFPVTIYGTSVTAGTTGSNGVLAFGTNANSSNTDANADSGYANTNSYTHTHTDAGLYAQL